jgi:hypothetical protein
MGLGVFKDIAMATHTFPTIFPIKGVRGASTSLLNR